ncbi:MAG: substrate-binding domain-containing protein, partial [Propionibacteriaceae bacterium]|nr:substrate-binding domain-containing protein [Propionibacteriaceae bacterium]
AALATTHLIDLGHTTSGHVSGYATDNHPATPTSRRREGWRQTLASHGLETSSTLDQPSDLSATGGYHATQLLLERRPDISAIFAASDEAAIGVTQAVRDRELTIGREVSVVGLDGHELSEFFGLTTVVQPIHDQGARAAEYLLACLDAPDDEPRELIFDTHLVRRTSTGPRVNS